MNKVILHFFLCFLFVVGSTCCQGGKRGAKKGAVNYTDMKKDKTSILELTQGLHLFTPEERHGMMIAIDENKLPAYDATGKSLSAKEISSAFQDETLVYEIYANDKLEPQLIVFKPLPIPSEETLPPMDVHLEYAPYFTAKDMKGNTVALKDLKGKVVVMNFWFTSCNPCIVEIPDLNTLVEQYKDNEEVVFLGITQDPKARVARFLEKHPFHYTLIPNSQGIMDSYIVLSYPTNIVLDKKGEIIYHSSGYRHQIDKTLRKCIEKGLK